MTVQLLKNLTCLAVVFILDDEKSNDLMYHFSGFPKPQFLNLPPRLGLSRKSNLPPLHKRPRIEEIEEIEE